MVDSIKLPLSIVVSSVEETERLGFLFARMLKDTGNRAFVAMYGDLGVGKTSFVRGFCSYFGISRVKSPTFSIVNEHHSDKDSVFHFDMYRITDEEDLYSTGFYEYFSRDGYMLCEWCENIPYAIPEDAYILKIEKMSVVDADKRTITIERKV